MNQLDPVSGYHPRLLGVDLGTKRIGIAVSDPLGLLAHPVLTFTRTRPRDDIRSVARLARRYECSAVVVGKPLHMLGEPSPMSIKAERFAAELGAFCALPVHLWDERLTTAEAHAILYASGRHRSEHGKVVDQIAAVLILQGFLDVQSQGV